MAFLRELAADNTREFWAAHRRRHGDVLGPARALAAALEPEFGPVRVFRPTVNRRFRPDAPPYRTDTGGAAASAGGCVLAVVLSAADLRVAAGHWLFDPGQLRRYRAAVDGEPGGRLAQLLARLDGLTLDRERRLVGAPRGFRTGHPRIDLLRQRGLQVGAAWPVGEWIGSREPLHRVRAAWRAAAPVVAWLDAHVGAGEPALTGTGRDLPQPRQGLPQPPHPGRAEVRGPLGLHLRHGGRGQRDHRPPALGDPDQPGARVGRIGHPFHVAGAFQLVHEEPGRLLGDLRLLGELGEPAAVRPDPLEHAGLRRGHVVVPGGGQRGEHPRLHRPVRDVEQEAGVELLRRRSGHPLLLVDGQSL
ncbi:hypothetical protein BJF78_06010 [Pseudonocardia sp. CNS-139]|nr:hypothetical protein BJF78_06010 [Pseudonocardia sp. CNS-139]